MIPHIKALVFILLLLVVSSFSGCAEGFKDGAKLPNSPVKGSGCHTQRTEPEFRTAHVPTSACHCDNIQMRARKLIGVDATLDYETPGSNGAHTPPDSPQGKRKGGSMNN